MDITRWHDLLKRMGLNNDELTYRRLIGAYSSPKRHYHNTQHIADCLQQLDQAASLAESAENVELALWFHDAVYRTWSSKNEYLSAQWAFDFLHKAGASDQCCAEVYQHIMATRHFALQHSEQPAVNDSRLVVDIDLSILGRDQTTFMQFEKNIRKEYQWVPEKYFKRRRRKILQSFLTRPIIYQTDYFRDCYEKNARQNLRKAIAALLG